MLVRAPKSGDVVTLICGCAATVRIGIPVLFMYWIQVRVPIDVCDRSHQRGANRIVGLENIRP
jgi:hypothetical protein